MKQTVIIFVTALLFSYSCSKDPQIVNSGVQIHLQGKFSPGYAEIITIRVSEHVKTLNNNNQSYKCISYAPHDVPLTIELEPGKYYTALEISTNGLPISPRLDSFELKQELKRIELHY